MKFLWLFIMLIIFTYGALSNELIPCHIMQGDYDNPTLKINKSTPYLYFDPIFVQQYMPELCSPPDVKIYPDSINMKYVKGIDLWGATINSIDESFFIMHYGDSLDGIYIRDTKFDVQNLIEQLLKYKIRLCSLYIDLKYAKVFPKKIEQIKGLSNLEVNFRHKPIKLDTNVFYNQQLRELKFMNRKVFNEEKFLCRIKGFKSLSLINCKNVNISKSLFQETSLEELSLTNCSVKKPLLDGINQFANCRTLVLEHCGIKDGQINYSILKNIVWFDLSNNYLTKFPKELLYFENSWTIYVDDNKIRDLTIKDIENFPKAKDSTNKDISLTTHYLNKKVKKYLEVNKDIIYKNKGYILRFDDLPIMKYFDYYTYGWEYQ